MALECLLENSLGPAQANSKFDSFTSRHTLVEKLVCPQLLLKIARQFRHTSAALGCDHLCKVVPTNEIKYRSMSTFMAR